MKKKIFANMLTLTLILTIFTGCGSGVSQEEYNRLVSELEDLQNRVNNTNYDIEIEDNNGSDFADNNENDNSFENKENSQSDIFRFDTDNTFYQYGMLAVYDDENDNKYSGKLVAFKNEKNADGTPKYSEKELAFEGLTVMYEDFIYGRELTDLIKLCDEMEVPKKIFMVASDALKVIEEKNEVTYLILYENQGALSYNITSDGTISEFINDYMKTYIDSTENK